MSSNFLKFCTLATNSSKKVQNATTLLLSQRLEFKILDFLHESESWL